MNRFEGKVLVISGAASGIGLATARSFASEGAAVVIADIDQENGSFAATEINRSGGQALYVPTDVSNSEQVKALMAATQKQFGRLDILMNNAYWTDRKRCEDVEEWEWDKTMDITLKGAFLCTKYALELLKENGGGNIINSASIHSLVAFIKHTTYQAAKSGLMGLTRSLALDYAPDIRVNALIIGCVESPALFDAPEDIKSNLIENTPLKRYGKPEEIAEAAKYLASDAASFITGTGLVIDGGWTIQ